MEAGRTATVLIAEPSDNAMRHAACRKAVTRAVINAADSTGGLVVSSSGGKLILRFATPDAAASAASKIHAALERFPNVGGTKPAMHIGFHTGESPDDTLSLAMKLVAEAQDGQTVTSRQTLERLNPAFREFSTSSRRCPTLEETPVCEIQSWHQKGVRPAGWAVMAVLRLTYRGQLAVCSREKDSVVIGREADCDLLVDSSVTSRRHCSIRFRGTDFSIHDHSSNGTYVTAGNEEIKLKKNGVLLPEQGVIAIGQPRAKGPELIEFCYALVT
jgi:hypothetical protein